MVISSGLIPNAPTLVDVFHVPPSIALSRTLISESNVQNSILEPVEIVAKVVVLNVTTLVNVFISTTLTVAVVNVCVTVLDTLTY